MHDKVEIIDVGSGADLRRIAVRSDPGDLPGLFWLGGFKSDMKGTKAQALDRLGAGARPRLRALRLFRPRRILRRDFTDGTIGRWLEESVAVFATHAAAVRRSWSARRWAAGSRCCWRANSAPERRAAVDGFARRHGADRARGRFHRSADVEAASRRRSSAQIDRDRAVAAAVGICRPALCDHPRPDRGGTQPSPARRPDRDRLSGAHPARRGRMPTCRGSTRSSSSRGLPQDDVVLTLVKDGDHRLSRPEDIERLLAAVAEF